MKKVSLIIINNIKILTAISLAALVGGVISSGVLAAIPDSNGQINACFKNSTKSLSVTDPAGNCGNGSTAIEWDQSGWKGYGYITPDGTLDSSRSKNVTSISQVVIDGTPQLGEFCIFSNTVPMLISAQDADITGGVASAAVRGTDRSELQVESYCGSTAKAAVFNTNSSAGTYFFFR